MQHLSPWSLVSAASAGFLLAALAVPQAANAHSVQTDYIVLEQKQLDITVTFSTGEAFANAPVAIYSPTNSSKPWLEGTTNSDGQFAFEPDRSVPGEWRLTVGKSDHADILSIPVNPSGIDADQISEQSIHNGDIATHTHTRDHDQWMMAGLIVTINAIGAWAISARQNG